MVELTKEQRINSLLKKYECYNGSAAYIYAAFYSLTFLKDKQIQSIIDSSFSSNLFDDFHFVTFRKLSAHWNNVAFNKLQFGDYQGYAYALSSCRNFKIIAHFLENNQSLNS